MRTVGSAVLTLEWLMLVLAVPVAIQLGGAQPWVALSGLGLVTVLIVLAIRSLPGPVGIAMGWVVQGLAIASAALVPLMAILGLMFGGLWLLAVRLGLSVDRARAARSDHEPETAG